MAEYKTYVCDICGEQEAHHITFPCGLVDLCSKHLLQKLHAHIQVLTKEEQRILWKFMGVKTFDILVDQNL